MLSDDPATRDELLNAVLASPAAVAAHDRAAWLGLFTPDAVVEDPVGSRPHIGIAAIGPFYDAFIAPNTIAFEPDAEIVTGTTVLRDLAIVIRMSTGATVRVPMHLRYDLVRRDDGWRIAHLAAHWEFTPMVLRLLGTGARGALAGVRLGGHLLTHLGPGGALGMMRAARGVGGRGRRAAAALLGAAADGDAATVRALAAGASAEYAGAQVTVADWADRLRGTTATKVLAAGRTVTASVRVDDRPAVAVAEFTGRRITALRLLTE